MSQHTDRGEEELVESDTLKGRNESRSLGNGKGLGQEAEPLVLDRRHEETVCHEAGQPLEVEGGRQSLRVGDEVIVGIWVLLVQLVDLDGKEVVFGDTPRLPHCPLSNSGHRLCDGICNASENLLKSQSDCSMRFVWLMTSTCRREGRTALVTMVVSTARIQSVKKAC